jgi:hypothetical protein
LSGRGQEIKGDTVATEVFGWDTTLFGDYLAPNNDPPEPALRHHVYHPRDTEAVRDHAEERGPEGLGQGHLHLATVGQGRKEALGFGSISY